MHFSPVRRTALAVHIPLGLVLLVAGAAGLWRLLRLPLNWQSALALLAVMAAAVGLPIVIGRILTLARGGYHIDSQALTIHWGADLEVIPLDDIAELRTGGGLSPSLRRRIGARSGWSRAQFKIEDGVRVESFATSSGVNLLLVDTSSGALAISPSDLAGFVDAFSRFSAAISAEKLPAFSSRPPTLSRELLSSRFARAVVATTSVALLLLGMMLLAVQPALALEHPFTFDASGLPSGLGSPARLLLLPAIGAIAWLIDLGLGWFAIRRRDYLAAYMLMGVGLMSTVGLWIGVLTLLRFA
jgi:Bacterial PH domain